MMKNSEYIFVKMGDQWTKSLYQMIDTNSYSWNERMLIVNKLFEGSVHNAGALTYVEEEL